MPERPFGCCAQKVPDPFFSHGPLGGRTELLGAVHLHTGHSDGTGDARVLAEAAAARGLDFVVVSDHDSLGVRADGGEGWHGRVLIAVGTEISTAGDGHLLALGNATAAGRYELTVEQALERVGAEGGQVYAAHPHGRGLFGRRRALDDWPYWSHPLLAGLEIWNYLHDWADSFRFWQPASYRLSEIAGRIQGPPRWLLARWDQQAARRSFPGLAGNDNHAKRLPLSSRRFFPHEALVGRLVNRVRLAAPLAADGRAAVAGLFAALAAGRVTVAREELASSEGFDFRVEAADGRALGGGQSAAFAPGARAVVESPRQAELGIVVGGQTLAAGLGRRLEAPLGAPGPVRAEARLEGRAWVFSNHVRLV